MPKIDLHRHLEGSLRLPTLAEIAHQHGVDLPSMSLEELRPYVQVVDDPPDFLSFLAKFKLLRRFYSSREAVERIAYESVADAAADNVRYLELRFSPVALALNQGFDFIDVVDWVILAVDRAVADHDIQVKLIVLTNRHEPQYAAQLAEIAVARKEQGIVGLDLAGDEVNFPDLTPFEKIFQQARADGLHITVHAAEAGPATNAREAIERLGAQRIGHGVNIQDNIAVMDLVKRQQVTLEICPTSNLQTGVVPKLGQHPLYSFHRIGIPVTINTDDPSISNTTLTDEFLVATRGVGVPYKDMFEMVINAARAAFLPELEKQRLVDWFTQAIQSYKNSLISE
ncbi:MAG: adenosine deaminase [Anaerolineae bacterium]